MFAVYVYNVFICLYHCAYICLLKRGPQGRLDHSELPLKIVIIIIIIIIIIIVLHFPMKNMKSHDLRGHAYGRSDVKTSQ